MTRPPPWHPVLIGMPGSGKSTVGVILAKKTTRDFVDTDRLIQKSRKRKCRSLSIMTDTLRAAPICSRIIAATGC
jgi:shikimate kinase